MKVEPFQELFIQQELTYNSSINNTLKGKAVFRVVDFEKLVTSLQEFIEYSEWSHTHLSHDLRCWVVKDSLSGKLSIKTPILSSHISVNNLWEIALYDDNGQVILEVLMHHALADAHSFQLFWSGLMKVYSGFEHSQIGVFCPNINFTPLSISNTKDVESQGIGPIDRVTVNFSGQRKMDAELAAKGRGILLSTLLLGVLQSTLDHIESYIGVKLQTGFALRNRSGRKARNSFLTAVNFLPITHFELNDLSSLEKLIKQLFRHQDYPLLEWLKDNQRNVAFNVLFSYQKEQYNSSEELKDVELTFLPAEEEETILGLHVIDFGDDDLKISFDFRTDLADQSFWRAFIFQYLKAVNAFLKNEKVTFNFAPIKLKTEYARTSLWENFENTPDHKLALVCEGKSLSFGELRSMLKPISLTQGSCVFISPERSVNNILSIIKAWKQEKTISFSVSSEVELPHGDFLYMAETSGSTGFPKRIGIRRSGIETMLNGWKMQLNMDENSVHLSTADQRFDVFFGDLFRSLFSGNTLIIASEDERYSPLLISELINHHQVTHYESTPSLLKLLIPHIGNCSSLEVLISGSESISLSMYDSLNFFIQKGVSVFNSYGLTEVSIDSALSELRKVGNDFFPVGFPIGDQCFSICNEKGNLMPAGIWGQLMISGLCVGEPLVWDEEKYKSENDKLVFSTGDRAMIHSTDGLIVRGRLQDDFIKVHGKRIPAKDLEIYILQKTDAENCFVFEKNGVIILLHDAKDEFIITHNFFSQRFSRHNLPDYIIRQFNWPLNKNGKIDKEKLKMQVVLPERSTKKWLPSNVAVEKKIYKELCKTGKSWGGAEESLLLYGWNSIELLSFCNELTMQGVAVGAATLIKEPTISVIIKQFRDPAADKIDESGEINLNDDDLNDILDIFNR